MPMGPTEVYHPRAVSDHGTWQFAALRLKVYGLRAETQSITEDTLKRAHAFTQSEVLARIKAMGDSNDLGFILIHPGTLGLSLSAHWWVQGSVLCQHIQRQLYTQDTTMDCANRPVIGCVWELELIQAEQNAWRKTMMSTTPNPDAYLTTRASGPT